MLNQKQPFPVIIPWGSGVCFSACALGLRGGEGPIFPTDTNKEEFKQAEAIRGPRSRGPAAFDLLPPPRGWGWTGETIRQQGNYFSTLKAAGISLWKKAGFFYLHHHLQNPTWGFNKALPRAGGRGSSGWSRAREAKLLEEASCHHAEVEEWLQK